MTSLSDLNNTRRPIRRTDDYLIYRDYLLGLLVTVVVMFNPYDPNDNVRFFFRTRAEAAQALWLELGKPYSLPPVFTGE